MLQRYLLRLRHTLWPKWTERTGVRVCCEVKVARMIVWRKCRPDLLSHQPYPTRSGSKVTRCRKPSDNAPTPTRAAPEPQGNGVSASIRRRRGEDGWRGEHR